MFRFVTKFSFSSHYLSTPEANVNLLKKFGIINPIIFRNLSYKAY